MCMRLNGSFVIFLFFYELQPPLQWAPGALSPGVKQLGREADYSPPASAEVKKMWIYRYTPPYAFMA
jgi:hypothetical protein